MTRFGSGGGGHHLERVTGGGVGHFLGPIFELFVRPRSYFSTFSSAQGLIVRFYPFYVTTFSFVRSGAIKMKYRVGFR